MSAPAEDGSLSRVRPIYTDDWPSFGDFDREALRRLIRKAARSGCRMLEVGSWMGGGSTQIFIQELGLLQGKLYCVDTWLGSPNVERHQELVRNYDLFGTFRHKVRAGGGEHLVHPIMMDSLEAAAVLADGTFDLVFLDGDHSYDATRADIAAWLPKVRSGGILCGHDCEVRVTPSNYARYFESRNLDYVDGVGTVFAVNHPGVIIAVHESFGEKAHLWAEDSPDVLAGNGCATIWDVTVPDPGTVNAG